MREISELKVEWCSGHARLRFYTILNVHITRKNHLEMCQNFTDWKGFSKKSPWNPQTRSEWLLQPYVQSSRRHKWSPKWFDTCSLHCHSLELIIKNHPGTLHSRVFSWGCCWVSMSWTTTNWQPSANSQNDDAISDFWWFSDKNK